MPNEARDDWIDDNNDVKELGRVKVSDSSYLQVSIVNKEYLDIRVWVETERYTGPTKKGIRMYLFDKNWEEFKILMDKVDKAYEKIA